MSNWHQTLCAGRSPLALKVLKPAEVDVALASEGGGAVVRGRAHDVRDHVAHAVRQSPLLQIRTRPGFSERPFYLGMTYPLHVLRPYAPEDPM